MSLTFKEFLIEVHVAEGEIDPEEMVQRAKEHTANRRNSSADDEDQQ